MHSSLLDEAQRLIDRLRSASHMLATAESCTGGLIAGLLTEIPGSSDVLERGFVTYSNAAKIGMLGVDFELIHRHGAVSAEVARAMADGALRNSAATVAVSVTGIAGPDGGTEQKPVGTVVFARAERKAGPDKIVADQKLFDAGEGRSGIRRQAALCALELLMP